MLDFEIHAKRPSVTRLRVHLEGDQLAHFRDADIVADIAARHGEETTLTSWLKANSAYPEATRGAKYHDPTNHFARPDTLRGWTPRGASKYSEVGRMYAASPMGGERYYVRLLLTEMTGRTSFADLKTLPDGTVCETFRDAAAARGLLMGHREHYHAFPRLESTQARGRPRGYLQLSSRTAHLALRAICGALFCPIWQKSSREHQYPKLYRNSTQISGR